MQNIAIQYAVFSERLVINVWPSDHLLDFLSKYFHIKDSFIIPSYDIKT